MVTNPTPWKDYLEDLDTLYEMALGKENVNAALKIKEIQIKAHQQEIAEAENFNLEEFPEKKLEHLINLIEHKIKNTPKRLNI